MTYIADADVRWLVIHYSATAIEADTSVDDIDRMHRARGFTETGYHKYIRKSGAVQNGRDLDKPGLFEQGAHSKGENSQSIGICFEGGVTRAHPNTGFDSRTPEQIASMITVIRELLKRFPNAEVIGHRDMPGAATQCPGFDATTWWHTVDNNPRNYPQAPGQFIAAFLEWLSGFLKSIGVMK